MDPFRETLRKSGITVVMLLFACSGHAQAHRAHATYSAEEREVITVVEGLLAACGANDFEAMEAMAAPGASAGYASLRDTSWHTGTMPWKDHVAHERAKSVPVMYTETDQHYTIHGTTSTRHRPARAGLHHGERHGGFRDLRAAGAGGR